MSAVSDKIDGMIVRSVSPDGGVTLSIRGTGEVTTEFSPGRYRQYSGPALERQLARTARLGWVGYQRGFKAVIDSVAGQEMLDDDHDDPQQKFQELRRQVVVTGSSPDRSVWVRSVGLTEWQFSLPAYPARTMREQACSAALDSALRTIVTEYRRQVEAAHIDLFDLDLPSGMLDELRGGNA